ncbi:hypothetical protein KC349_g7948 [Hortaea werneckii]|nr:hypothetical protein KC349_g7948 [Hortaea werneckii]
MQVNDEPVLGTIQYSAAPAAGPQMSTPLTSDQSRLITETADLVKQLASKVQNLEDENQRLFFEMERWKVEAHQLAQEEDRLIHEESKEGEDSESSEEEVGGKHIESLEATERQIGTESDHVKVGPLVEEDQGPTQDNTLQDAQVQANGMRTDRAQEVPPSIEHPAKPQILYAVVHRHVDEENDGIGFVVVLRQELDVQPQRREDPVPRPLPTWSPPPKIRSYAQDVELSDHEPEGPWWQPKPSTDQPWDMDYDLTSPFYSQAAIAERGGQREFLGRNHHPSVPPASSSPPPNMQGLVPESLGPFGLPASALLDPERGVLKPHLSLAPGLDLQKFGLSQPREAMNHSKPRKPRKPRSDRGIPRTGRSGKRGRKTA